MRLSQRRTLGHPPRWQEAASCQFLERARKLGLWGLVSALGVQRNSRATRSAGYWQIWIDRASESPVLLHDPASRIHHWA